MLSTMSAALNHIGYMTNKHQFYSFLVWFHSHTLKEDSDLKGA